eukprot:EG_transcript_6899
MAALPDRYAGNAGILGGDVLAGLSKARLLVVGAGGIGCELLKTLVLTGFEDIEIIDLDTIDASNLNRQFLFRKGDVGKSKAEVAQRAAAPFNPLSKVVAHHGNIKDGKFGDEFFRKFDLVINALDNLDARKHVNRMCIKTDRPLIESGTRGFVGQVQPIRKGVFECFDCRPRHEARQYAYCTIRSSPTRMVHCVAFAKVLYEHLFGTPQDDDDPVQFGEVCAASEAAAEDAEGLAVRLFNKMHHTTIHEVLALKDKVWTTAKPVPTPLYHDFAAGSVGSSVQRVLPGPEQAKLFVTSFVELRSRDRAQFDKDDDLAVQFVSAVSNLRALVYHIPMESQFDVKAIAGNIVPAIATTNAIISGTVVLEAIKLLSGRTKDCRMTFCTPIPKKFFRKPCILYPSELVQPDPKCYVCSDRKRRIHVLLDTHLTTLGFFVKEILQGYLSFAEPLLDSAQGGIYDHELHQGHPKLLKPLVEVGVKDGCELVVADSLQDLEFEVSIVHVACSDPSEFQVEGDSAPVSAAAQPTAAATSSTQEDDGDEPTIYVPKDVRRAEKRRRTDPAEPTAATAKRPHPTGDPADAISVE